MKVRSIGERERETERERERDRQTDTPEITWANEMIFVMNHALVQVRSLFPLISTPARHHCAMDAPGLEMTWANEMTFVINHAPGTGSITLPIDQQTSTLPLCYGCPLAGHDLG